MELHHARPLGSSDDAITPATWRCIVCQKPTNEIHVLPCQHKFCYNCLELWAGIYLDMYHGSDGQFPCQICWKLYDVPSQGIRAFVQDCRVNALEDCLQQMTFGQGCDPRMSGRSPFGGQWDAGTTAEAAFDQQLNPGTISPAKTQVDSPGFPTPSLGQNTMIANINCDDEALMTSEGGATENMMMSQEGSTVCPQQPAGGFSSMVSHMAPQPMLENQESNLSGPRPDYCLRSHHMYMHMV